MNEKPKSAPQSPLAYWWNEFLFARSFAHTTSLSPDDCQTALYGIEHPVEGGWFTFNSMSKSVNIQPTGNHDAGTARFDIRLKRRNRGIDYTMAKAEGTITRHPETGETLVRGRTKFGAFYYLLMVGYAAIFGTVFLGMSSYSMETFSLWMVLLLFGIVAYTWWRMFTDRNSLTETITDTLRAAELSAPGWEKNKHGAASINPALLGVDERSGYFRKR